jgi:hypothetical protein
MQFTARLLCSVCNREANDAFLIGTQHLDLNDPQVRDEIQRVTRRPAGKNGPGRETSLPLFED